MGVVLVIGPWNYPVQLALSPLVAAVAAGNCAAVKLSEQAPAVSAALARLLSDVFDSSHVAGFEGDAETGRALLALPFDHVFFTGGTAVGRDVMRAAARRPASVTLELGGKNPCIVCADADLETAARRIAWGKFLNAGQTCVAPDTVLVARAVHDRFIELLVRTIRAFYGEDPQCSPDYGRIVSDRHFERLSALLGQGTVACGGGQDAATRYIAPTVVLAPAAGSELLSEEIFGPILPVVPFDSLDDELARLRRAPSPLALYLFTSSRQTVRRVLLGSRSGGVCVNDTVNQVVCRRLPFGGVGASGTGRYHGRAGFDCFSYSRSVLERSTRLELGKAYPPFKTPLAVLKRVYGCLLGG
jgi:aldehyde dehydrogenase (NAD+)